MINVRPKWSSALRRHAEAAAAAEESLTRNVSRMLRFAQHDDEMKTNRMTKSQLIAV